MRTLRLVAGQPLGLLIGFAIASILFLATFTLAWTSGRVLATHGGSSNIHACVSIYTGQARIMRPGQAPNCSGGEQLVEWPGTALAADLAELEARLAELACIQSAPGANTEVQDIVFTGCNVQIVNGLSSTETTNAVGNLIVGYSTDQGDPNDRGGSHNLVVGDNHTYSSFGGFVTGQTNQVTGAFASVSGGFDNIASGDYASVSGGEFNMASGERSSVSGGDTNEASGNASSVSGGRNNHAAGANSSVSGGGGNAATGGSSSVSGGENNTASGDQSSVSGGLFRTTNNADPTHDWRAGNLIEDD